MPEDGDSIIALSGRIDLRSIHTYARRLEQAFGAASGKGASLGIDLAQVTEADATLVHLIEQARRNAARSGVAIRLCEPAQGTVLQTLERGGFLTDPPDALTRFWCGS
jgi:anti-anti-sigma regulatory factor